MKHGVLAGHGRFSGMAQTRTDEPRRRDRTRRSRPVATLSAAKTALLATAGDDHWRNGKVNFRRCGERTQRAQAVEC
jgi:hypothetical protein